MNYHAYSVTLDSSVYFKGRTLRVRDLEMWRLNFNGRYYVYNGKINTADAKGQFRIYFTKSALDRFVSTGSVKNSFINASVDEEGYATLEIKCDEDNSGNPQRIVENGVIVELAYKMKPVFNSRLHGNPAFIESCRSSRRNDNFFPGNVYKTYQGGMCSAR